MLNKVERLIRKYSLKGFTLLAVHGRIFVGGQGEFYYELYNPKTGEEVTIYRNDDKGLVEVFEGNYLDLISR